MHLQMTMFVWACGMLLLLCPCATLGQDAIDAEIRDEMMALHPDVRMPGLAAIKRKYGLTDDDFSARLVKLATVTTNGVDSWLRGFTICAIRDFGTTNALVFLKSEALCGGSSAGIKGYGLITGFDDRFFDLAERILVNKNKENTGRRDSTYRVFQSLMCSDQLSGREVPTCAKTKAKEALVRHSFSDSYHRVLIDMILAENDFEEPSYKNSPERLRIARVACDDPNSSDYARGYFGGVLEQMEREAAATNVVSIKTIKNEQEHKPTSNLDSKAEESANGEDPLATNEKAQYRRIVLSLLVILVAVLSFARLRRQRRAKARAML